MTPTPKLSPAEQEELDSIEKFIEDTLDEFFGADEGEEHDDA